MAGPWRRLLSWLAGGQPTDPRSQILRAITAIRAQHRELERHEAAAYVGAVRIDRQVALQRAVLTGIRAEIETAIAAARRAGESARAEGGAAAALPYTQTVSGLRSQLDVVDVSARELEGMRGGAAQNVERTRELLAANRQRLDVALREQLDLLNRIEQLERRRAIEKSRRPR